MLNGDGADLIDEAKCGLAVPANDKTAFADAVKKMSEMKESERMQLGENGRNYYEQHFRKEQRIEQLDEILRKAVSTK